MNALRKALADYLAVRRSLGYGLVRSEKLLAQFLGYLEARGEDRVTSENALAWATLPAGAHQSWRSYRLCAVRGFARHLKAFGSGDRGAARRAGAVARLSRHALPLQR